NWEPSGLGGNYYEELTRRGWEVTINHIFSESNFLANSLAAKCYIVSFGSHNVEASDPAVAHWSAYDTIPTSVGVASHRGAKVLKVGSRSLKERSFWGWD
ncbi:hypothetical protein LINPERHAP1_LOCUS34726, partial [Linum perenne]